MRVNQFAVTLRAHLLVCCSLLFMVTHASAQELPKAALEKMESEKFQVREAGYKELDEWVEKNPDSSPEILHATWSNVDDPEVKTRCYELMKEAVVFRKFGPGPGFIGIMMGSHSIRALNPGELDTEAVIITQVMPDTPGKRAGLLAGDIVLRVNEYDLNQPVDGQQKKLSVVDRLSFYIKSKHPEDVITLHIIRLGEKIDKDVKLTLRPDFDDRDERGRKKETRTQMQERYFKIWLQKMAG